jgi:tRNA modification GTPase
MNVDDVIAAICTAPGAAGLAVLRVSGEGALRVAGRVFRGADLDAAPSHTLHHGWVWSADGRERLDEVVASVFRSPRSYTGEDVVELSCHGGRFSAERVLDALVEAGARRAQPGEYTLRAFLSGRVDLAQAEAVADVIHAETEASHRLALDQLAGALSRRLADIETRMLDALAEVEARVDFAEDVGGVEAPPHVRAAVRAVAAELLALRDGSAWARAVREGVRVPIVGRPNVGKSSVFNALLGEERAIVAAVPGTTRDRVSEPLEVEGVRVVLSDTAGLRETADAIEAIGVGRTRAAVEESRLVLWVVDGSAPLTEADRDVARTLAGKQVLVALNKRDLGVVVSAEAITGELPAAPAIAEVSARDGRGVDSLRHGLSQLLGVNGGSSEGGRAVLAHPRHVDAVSRAVAALERAAAAADEDLPGEVVALELREAIDALGEISGRRVDSEVLDRIFARFCIGK